MTEYIIMIFGCIFIIVSLILLYLGVTKLNQARNIVIEKSFEQENIKNEINNLLNERDKLESNLQNEKLKFDNYYETEKNRVQEAINAFEENAEYQKSKIQFSIDKMNEEAQKQYNEVYQQIECENEKLIKLKETLRAGVEAQLREREKEENIKFYKLQVSDSNLDDIKKLHSIKSMLHDPVILSKLIWTQYFQKQTTDMCNRILGKEKVCGIYKITNINTGQTYIGQSVN